MSEWHLRKMYGAKLSRPREPRENCRSQLAPGSRTMVHGDRVFVPSRPHAAHLQWPRSGDARVVAGDQVQPGALQRQRRHRGCGALQCR